MARKPSTAQRADSTATKQKTARKPAARSDEQKISKKAPGRPFQKGKSGNPGGRPKEVQEVRDLARKHTVAAIQRLVELMNDDNGRTSVAACTVLLDRAWGKAPQAIEHSGKDGVPLTPTLHVTYG